MLSMIGPSTLRSTVDAAGCRLFAICLLLCASLALGQTKIDPARETLQQTGKIPILVISGNDTFHRWKETTPQLRTILEEGGRFETRLVEDVYILESAAALSRYKAIILNQQVPKSTPEMRRNLERYVRSGGGLIAIHWAIDNFQDWPEFVNLIGRRWKEGSSGEEHGTFAVKVGDRTHPIGRKLNDFQTAEEDAVHYDLSGDAKVQVIATAYLPEAGRDVPVAYAYQPDKGRVFFTSLGHSKVTRDSPGFRELISRAVEWAATGDVQEK